MKRPTIRDWWAKKPGQAFENYQVSWEGLHAFIFQWEKLMWDLVHEPSWETRPVLRLDNFRAEAMMNLYTEARVLYMKMATYLEMWGMEVRKLNWLMALSKNNGFIYAEPMSDQANMR